MIVLKQTLIARNHFSQRCLIPKKTVIHNNSHNPPKPQEPKKNVKKDPKYSYIKVTVSNLNVQRTDKKSNLVVSDPKYNSGLRRINTNIRNILSTKPDIVTLQEVCKLNTYHEGLGDKVYDTFYEPRIGMISAIFWKFDTFTSEKTFCIPLPHTKRGITAVILKLKNSQQRLLVVNVHLKAKKYNSHIREEQIKTLHNFIHVTQYKYFIDHIMLNGDFNTDFHSDEMLPIRVNFENAHQRDTINGYLKYTTRKQRLGEDQIVNRISDFMLHDKWLPVLKVVRLTDQHHDGTLPNQHHGSDHIYQSLSLCHTHQTYFQNI